MLQDCEVSGNTDGIRLVANYTCAIGCIAHDNTDDGFAQCGDYMVYCLSYGNGGVGFELDCTAFSGAKLINCTALRNGSDGIYINRDGDARALILNCISARNGPTAYGLNASAPTICVGGANLIPASGADANTSGAINNVTFVDSVAVNLATSATANFVNPADGEENLALQSGSAAKGAGWPGAMLIGGTGYMDIGALQRAEPTLPTEAQVEDGVQYGDGGTQYEGQLVAGGGADLPDCIMVGI
jgi:hypothetical protein